MQRIKHLVAIIALEMLQDVADRFVGHCNRHVWSFCVGVWVWFVKGFDQNQR